MARLIGWWPLHKDTRDWSGNGNDFIIEGSTCVENSQGIIGHCWNTTTKGQTSYLITERDIDLPEGSHCMFCHLYVTDLGHDTSANGVVTHHDHSPEDGTGITLKAINTSTFRVSCNTGYKEGGRTYYTYYGQTDLVFNQWYHVGFTYNSETKDIHFYVDGLPDGTSNIGNKTMSMPPNKLAAFLWSLSEHSTNYRPAQKINDIRVYSGTLSDAEIRELAQAKILHWTFDDPSVFSVTNLYNSASMRNWSCTSSSEGEWRYKITGTGSWRGITQANVSDRVVMEPDGVYCLSFEMLSEDRDIQIYVDVNSSGLTTSTGTNDNTQWRDFNGRGSSHYLSVKRGQWTTYWVAWQTSSGQQFREETIIGAIDSTDLGDAGAWFRVRNIQLTQSRYPLPYSPFGSPRSAGLVRDLSGLGNDGQSENIIVPVEDAAYGGTSIYLDGGSYLTCPNPLSGYGTGSRQQWTVSVWFKLKAQKDTQKLLNFCNGLHLEWGSTGKASAYLNSGESDFYRYSNEIDYDSGWQHVVITFDNREGAIPPDIYINGSLSNNNSTNRANNPLGLPAILHVGETCHGCLDDLRVYGRALSAEEVADLYHVRATLSDTGRLRCSRIIETSDKELIDFKKCHSAARGWTFDGSAWIGDNSVATDIYPVLNWWFPDGELPSGYYKWRFQVQADSQSSNRSPHASMRLSGKRGREFKYLSNASLRADGLTIIEQDFLLTDYLMYYWGNDLQPLFHTATQSSNLDPATTNEVMKLLSHSLVPMNIPRWTFHYNQNSYFKATKWLPSGSFEIKADLLLPNLQPESGLYHWLKIGSTSGANLCMHSRALSDGALQFGFHGNDVQTAAGAFRPHQVNKFYFKYEKTSETHGTMTLRCNDVEIKATNRAKYAGDGVVYFGSEYSIGWLGQITNVELIDLDVPHNSRFYGGIYHQDQPPSSVNIKLIDECGWQQLQQMTACTLQSESGVKYSETVAVGSHLIIGEKYRCTVNLESVGGSNPQSGWSSRNGIDSSQRWTTPGVRQFEFTCTATNQDLLLFTYGTATFKNIKVERNTDGVAYDQDAVPWVRQLRTNEQYLSDSPLILGKGISYDINNNVVFTSKIEPGGTIAGSWDGARNKGYPTVNSIWVAPNGAQVTNAGTIDVNGYVGGIRSKGSSIRDIIEGFQYPNVFRIYEPDDPEFEQIESSARKNYQINHKGQVKTNLLSEVGLTNGLVGYWNFRQDLRGLCLTNGEMEFYTGDHAETTLTSEGVLCTRSATDKISGGIYRNSGDLCLVKGQELTESFTLCVWCCPSQATQDKEAILIAKHGNHTGLVIEQNKFSFRFPMANGTSVTNCMAINTVEANRWYKVIGVKNRTSVKLYVDGVLNNSKTIAGDYLFGTGEQFRLSSSSRSNTGTPEAPVWRSNYQFQGIVAEAKIFNRPLTDEEAKWESSRHLKAGSIIGGNLMINHLSENII